ncbi:MAG: hypothetical protein K2W85_12825 [Phycisphaerales bacterium]|nr:hypothetical protein [Phycisphaerales bacterium]
MTLLEVVLAVLMISLVALVVTSAVNSIMGMEANGRKRLAAYEVANRLMLTYLDDPENLPSESNPIEYGSYRFLYEVELTPSRLVINRTQEATGASLQKLDRFRMIGITVYDALESDVALAAEGEPLAALSRAIDPFTPRNPDSIESLGRDQRKIGKLVGGLLGDQSEPERRGSRKRAPGQ